MKLLAVVGVYLVSLAVIAALAFVIVIVVAGPHSGLLPEWAEALVLAAGWLTVLVVPAFIARAVWRRFDRKAG